MPTQRRICACACLSCARAQADSGHPLAAARSRARLDGLLGGVDRERNRDALLKVLATMPLAEREARARELPRNDALQPWLEQGSDIVAGAGHGVDATAGAADDAH